MEATVEITLYGWLRLASAARLAGVGRSTLDAAAARGEIPHAWLAGQRFFRQEDVEAWAKARGKEAA